MAQSKIVQAVKVVDADRQLSDHLRQAEEHLIEAVRLFERKTHPNRTQDYVGRLTRAQEMVTHLFREELVRIRGPIKLTVSAGKKRKK